MSQALYRKYRSRSLDDIVGQEHITALLKRAIESGNVSHAYLLTGPRGVGKTSIARIIAHQINGLEYTEESEHLDIIEIDAASNNGVEDVRDLRDKVHVAPSSALKKIYIIDEVHMLSKPAFNALLKTLEEPPAHVVFILATTDVERLPATIISRVQQFNFRTIPVDKAVKHLRYIADQEGIKIDDDALELIAKHGGGSFRDSISLLDQLRHSAGKNEIVTVSHVNNAVGATEDEVVNVLINAYRRGDIEDVAATVRRLESSGAYAATVTRQLIDKLQAGISAHPEDVKLLDGLLEVTSSSYPYIKLLTTIVGAMNQSLTARPSVPTDSGNPADRPKTTSKPPMKELKKSSSKTSKEDKTKAKSEPAPIEEHKSNVRRSLDNKQTIDLDWSALLQEVDTPLKSLLAPSKHIQDGDTVTIYAGTKFKANQLSSPKQQSKLQAALQKIGASDLVLDIRGEKAPPSDSQTAAVAAIMGGGEEVAYDG